MGKYFKIENNIVIMKKMPLHHALEDFSKNLLIGIAGGMTVFVMTNVLKINKENMGGWLLFLFLLDLLVFLLFWNYHRHHPDF